MHTSCVSVRGTDHIDKLYDFTSGCEGARYGMVRKSTGLDVN